MLPEISGVMTLMGRHFIVEPVILTISLPSLSAFSWAWISCWANSRIAGDLRQALMWFGSLDLDFQYEYRPWKRGLSILLTLGVLSKRCQKSYHRDNWLVAARCPTLTTLQHAAQISSEDCSKKSGCGSRTWMIWLAVLMMSPPALTKAARTLDVPTSTPM